jgi:orotate phosphoribosyltransferase
MTDDEILDEFRAAEALLEGHFILSSGLRSPRYLQCARVLMDPARAERLAKALAAKLPAEVRDSIDAIVSPAMGGVIIGHEMGRALGKKAMFVERPEGQFGLRRGFRLEPGERVLLVEDVVTTGLSSREAIAAVAEAGGTVIGAAALVDRSAGKADLGVPFTALMSIRTSPRPWASAFARSTSSASPTAPGLPTISPVAPERMCTVRPSRRAIGSIRATR